MTTALKRPFENGDRSTPKINKLNQLYANFQNERVQMDGVTFKMEVEQFKSYANEIKQIEALIKTYKVKADQNLQNLKKDTGGFESQRKQFEASLSQFEGTVTEIQNQIASLKQQFIAKTKNRIEIATTVIKINQLKQLELEDRKSEAHQVFKWVLLVFYKEPTSKYYWDNFKEEAFENDKGVDFTERLGKLSAIQFKEEERLSTEKVLANKNKYLDHPELAKVRSSIDGILQIATLFTESNDIAKRVRMAEIEISKKSEERTEKEQLYAKAKAKKEALQERIHIAEKYITVLADLEARLTKKEKQYGEVIGFGDKLVQELRVFLANPQAQLTPIKKDNCTIF